MARRGAEPRWLSRVVVDALHYDQLREHGGRTGMRDENALESALARPRQKWRYSERIDVPALAACYAFGMVQNHAYYDGNKRVGFLAMLTFLGLNGYDFTADERDVVTVMLELANGRIREERLASWIRRHGSPL